MSEITIRTAGWGERERLVSLLRSCGLGDDNLLVEGSRYWFAQDISGMMVGAIGMEFSPTASLIRSAAVLPATRRQGLGSALVARALSAARAHAPKVYLFSSDAGGFWMRFGFAEVPMDELVAALPDAPQVVRYRDLGWLAIETAWRCDLA